MHLYMNSLKNYAASRYLQTTLMLTSFLILSACSSNGSNISHSQTNSANSSYSSAQSDALFIRTSLEQAFQDWKGTPYRLGGESKSGVDCSSLVQHIYRRTFAKELPRTTEQQVELGRQVSESELAPGDLVFFKTGRDTRHVGIYLSRGRFINASSSKGVIISRLDNPYWSKHYWQSRRII